MTTIVVTTVIAPSSTSLTTITVTSSTQIAISPTSGNAIATTCNLPFLTSSSSRNPFHSLSFVNRHNLFVTIDRSIIIITSSTSTFGTFSAITTITTQSTIAASMFSGKFRIPWPHQ